MGERVVWNMSTLAATLMTLLTQLTQSPLQFSGDFLQLAVIFFVLALVAAVLGATNVAGVSMQIAKWFVIIFIALAIISIVL